MGTILEGFKEFLQSILDFHQKSISDTPNKSVAQKSQELLTFTNDFNIKALDRAVEILAGSNLAVDKGKLSVELATIIKEFSKKFLDTNFKTS